MPRQGQSGGGDGPSLAITAIFLSEFTNVLLLSVSMKEVSMEKVASEYPFYILMYMIFHLFHFFFLLEKHI